MAAADPDVTPSDAPPSEPAASPQAHEPPPAPAKRSITPAPEDFASPPPPQRLLWPVLWCALGAVLIAALHQTISTSGWPASKEKPADEAPAAH